jgi:hypothetical protein
MFKGEGIPLYPVEEGYESIADRHGHNVQELLGTMTEPDSAITFGVFEGNVATYLQKELCLNQHPEINIEEIKKATVETDMEEEQRVFVEPTDPAKYENAEWINDFTDYYDQTRTFRIRNKNGVLRMTIKIPFLVCDTETTRCCLRIEIKAVPKKELSDPEKQEAEERLQKLYSQIKDLLVIKGSKPEHKNGLKLSTTLPDSEPLWLNKNDNGEMWVEADIKGKVVAKGMGLENLLPSDLRFVGYRTNLKNRQPENQPAKEGVGEKEFKDQFIKNIKAVSRTSLGMSDTSVSAEKEKTALEGEELAHQVDINTENIAEYIWEVKKHKINSVETLKTVLAAIVEITNKDISKRDPYDYRTWPVDYSKISPENIQPAMNTFYEQYFEKLRKVVNREMSAYETAIWAEYTINRDIHPFQDGCNRISMSWGVLALAIAGEPQPKHESRDGYLKAINGGFEQFRNYYLEHVQK